MGGESSSAFLFSLESRGATTAVDDEVGVSACLGSMACLLAQAAGADFVKTSTGFGPGGATVEDVNLMRRVVGPGTGVKAAGGVRTYQDVLAMIAAGANRIGASAGIAILNEALGVSQ